MKTWNVFLKNIYCLFALIILLVGCRGNLTISGLPSLTINDISTAFYIESQVMNSGVCLLDRGPIDRIFPEQLTLTEPYAGYGSIFKPGEQPVPCDRLIVRSAKGVFNFDLSSFLIAHTIENVHSAIINIKEFTPLGGDVRMQIAAPWGNNLYIIPQNPIQNFAEFEIKKLVQTWTPAIELNRPITGPLAAADLHIVNREQNKFLAPLVNGSSAAPHSFDITEEIKLQILNSTTHDLVSFFGFMISPVALPPYKSDCHAIGSFKVELVIYLNN